MLGLYVQVQTDIIQHDYNPHGKLVKSCSLYYELHTGIEADRTY